MSLLPVERSGELEVTISFRPQELGHQEAELSVGSDSVRCSQLVLP